MPLLPAFSGEVESDTDGRTMRVQLYWEYRTISRGGNSIYEILEKELGISRKECENYISFYGLRNHDKIENPKEAGKYIMETE